jgi:hypothetical protein
VGVCVCVRSEGKYKIKYIFVYGASPFINLLARKPISRRSNGMDEFLENIPEECLNSVLAWHSCCAFKWEVSVVEMRCKKSGA